MRTLEDKVHLIEHPKYIRPVIVGSLAALSLLSFFALGMLPNSLVFEGVTVFSTFCILSIIAGTYNAVRSDMLDCIGIKSEAMSPCTDDILGNKKKIYEREIDNLELKIRRCQGLIREYKERDMQANIDILNVEIDNCNELIRIHKSTLQILETEQLHKDMRELVA